MNNTNIKSINSVDKIINTIESMSGKYNPYVIFTDWVKMSAISIQNSCDIFHGNEWKSREKQYLDISGKYSEKELKNFCEMFGLLNVSFQENGVSDYLGDIYMRSGAGSKYTGQFFTPYHVSLLTAKLRMANISNEWIEKNGKIKMNEPSVGGGGMVLAAAHVLMEKGINYQRYLDVVAQDIDWNVVYMSYVQMSIVGIKATVVQCNTLTDEYDFASFPNDRIFRTPARMGVLL